MPQPEPTLRCLYLRCLKLLLGARTVSGWLDSFSCVYMAALAGLCGKSVGEGGVVGVDEVEKCTVPFRLR